MKNSTIEKSYDELTARIAKNIKRIRKLRGLSQSNMAKYGFDVRNYQRLEQGNHSPSLFTLHKLSDIFNVAIEEFFKK